MASLLRVDELRVEFALSGSARVRALRGIHLQIEPGICYGILGESGSGKSTLAKAVMQLLPVSAKITSGAIEFNGRDISKFTAAELQRYHGKEVAFVPQEPGLALNPVMKIGEQIAEVLRAHNRWPSQRYRSEAESLARHRASNRDGPSHLQRLSPSTQRRPATARRNRASLELQSSTDRRRRTDRFPRR